MSYNIIKYDTKRGILMKSKKTFLEKLGILERIEDDMKEELKPQGEIIVIDNNNKKEEDEGEKDIFVMDKFFSINEIYSKLSLPTKGTDTIFIMNSFLEALPQNLPLEVKRKSVQDLVIASGMDIEALLQDGFKRLTELNIFREKFSAKIEEDIVETEKDIDRLLEKINERKKFIADRKQLEDEQMATVQYETQKIQNILDFMSK